MPFVVKFHCREKISRKLEEWDGYVESIHNYGSHYEIQIESRSGFIFMVGNYVNGNFISIPAFGVGCEYAKGRKLIWIFLHPPNKGNYLYILHSNLKPCLLIYRHTQKKNYLNHLHSYQAYISAHY